MDLGKFKDINEILNNDLAESMFRKLLSGGNIKTINIHNTPEYSKDDLEKQLKYFKDSFCNVTYQDIVDIFNGKPWTKEKPGLIISVFEGYRNNYDVYLPLLEKYGFTGWFFVITEFINLPIEEQIQFALDNDIDPCEREDAYYPDGRIAITWEELKEISKNHVVISHTKTHFRITKDTPEDIMYEEIVGSKLEIEKHIGEPVEMFCWLGGERFGYNKKATQFIKDAGYKYLFSGAKIEKIKD